MKTAKSNYVCPYNSWNNGNNLPNICKEHKTLNFISNWILSMLILLKRF